MKESDLVQAHLNEYESLSCQITTQGKIIEDELKAILLMSSLPLSWETFVSIVCNASTTVVKYSSVTSAILTEAAWSKSFVNGSVNDAYVVQGPTDQSNSRTISEDGASHRIIEYAITARNSDISKSIAVH